MLIYSLNFAIIKRENCTDFDIFTKYLIISTTQGKLRAKFERCFENSSLVFSIHPSNKQNMFHMSITRELYIYIYIYTLTHTYIYIYYNTYDYSSFNHDISCSSN